MSEYRKYLVIFLASFSLLILAIFYFRNDGVLAIVGESKITGEDINYRIGLEKAYGSESSMEGALVSLVNDSFEEQVARLHGVSATAGDIEQLRKSSDATSKAPEILEKVKNAFGNDSLSYDRIYLKPKIINVKLHSFYSRDPIIHVVERANIEKAYSLVVSGKSFAEVANESSAIYKVNEISEEKIVLPEAIGQYFSEEEGAFKNPLIEIVKELKSGEVFKNIIEDDYSYQVVKLIRREGSIYKIESVIINKKSFDEWFNGEFEKIKIEILDKSFKDGIKAKYSQVPWVKRI